MGRKSTDKEVRARQELIFRARSQHVPWERIADSFDPPISVSQAQKDHRKACERRQEETAESGDWLLEQEAPHEEIARTAWDMIRRATETLRNDPVLNSQLLFAIDRFLRTAMAAEDRIAELRGLRLGRRKDGERPPASLASMADVISLVEQALADVEHIEDPAVRSRILARLAQVALKVREKADLEKEVQALEEVLSERRKS